MRTQATPIPRGAIVATASSLAEIPLLAMYAEGGTPFSAYEMLGGITFWIITERDRSAATVLLPEGAP